MGGRWAAGFWARRRLAREVKVGGVIRERGRARPSQVWDIPLGAGVVLIRSGGIGGGVPPFGW